MTNNTEKHDIFPLPLTIFEKYFLMDTSADYPMLLEGKLFLAGNLDRQMFESSVRTALNSHPLFLKKIEWKRRRPYWSRAVEPFAVKWADTPDGDDAGDARDDADDNVGECCPMRITVEQRDDQAVMHYLCHHARCDAMGLFRFLGDIFAAYATGKGESVPESCPIEAERIVERDRFQAKELPEKLSAFRIFGESLKGVLNWMKIRPLPLGEKSPDFVESETRFGKISHPIVPATFERLRQYAKSHDATLNDLVMTLLFAAVAKWQRERFASDENRPLRFNIPVNMRWDGCGRIPAANIISYDFMTRTIRECLGDPQRLLEGVHEEMRFFKDWQSAFVFLDSLAFFNRIPGGLRRMIRSKTSLASLVYSNVGIIDRAFGHEFQRTQDHKPMFGGLRLDDIQSFAPCRAMTHLSIVFATLACRSALHCRYDRELISDEQMRLLLQYYDGEQTRLLQEQEADHGI